MPPVVLDVQRADDQRDVVHRAVQALAEGRLAALPTETLYCVAAAALDDEAVGRLLNLAGACRLPLALALRSPEEAWDYVPRLSRTAQRLMRRCWPGPVTLLPPDSHPDSAVQQLAPRLRRQVAAQGGLGLRCAAHPVVGAILRLLAGPVACLELVPAAGADQLRKLDERIDLVLDDGLSRLGQPATVVRIGERDGFEIASEGAVTASALQRLAGLVVLLVCTGNTCRSPMAEVLLRRRLAERLGCRDDELSARGVAVLSAGVSAMAGGRPSEEAVSVMAERGLDLLPHESQPVTDRLVRSADLILTMTRSHRDTLLAHFPEAAPRTHTLCRDETDVADPIGGPAAWYRRCAEQIDAQLPYWVAALEQQGLGAAADAPPSPES